MFNKFLVLTFAFVLLTAACSSATPTNANINPNINVTIDPANIPPEFSNKSIDINGNLPPGIPNPQNANSSNPSKGATPTPGIPAEPGKPLPKGATPTPGIPDENTLRKQMQSNSQTKPVKPPSADDNGDKSANGNRNP